MNLKVTSPTFDYSIIQNKEKFEYRNQGKIYSYSIKKCNETLFKNFWEQFEYKMNQKSSATQKSDAVATDKHSAKDSIQNTNKKSTVYSVLHNSKKINVEKNGLLGRYLASLPEDIRALKLAERVRCEK